MAVPAVDQRDRLQPGAPRQQLDGRHGRRIGRSLLRQPWPDRPGVARQDPRTRRLLPQDGARGAGQLSPSDGWHRGRDRWTPLGLHRRLRPCAGAHQPVLQGGQAADLGRYGAAAHLDQCVGRRRRARGRPTDAVSELTVALSRAAGRHAGAALPWQALHGSAPAHRPAARASRRAPGRGGLRLRRRADACRRPAVGAVQAQARPAPDHVRDGRGDRAPECSLAQGRAAARAVQGRRLPLLARLTRSKTKRRRG
mmetsp:Transcript_53307/g.125311  ORF Transcript_53307/g.125311 Transcript_53307/m.125311 type:complete len:254 (+) Transcript_53307:1133-1894(+)